MVIHRSAGFSLVELTMVVAIVAIVSAIAVPRLSNATVRYQLDAAARRLTGDIEYAQQEAIASSSSRTLTFNFLGMSYTITKRDSSGNASVVSVISLNDGPYRASSLTASIAGNTSTPIIFDGFGKPNGAGTIQLKLGAETRIITMDGITGRLSVR